MAARGLLDLIVNHLRLGGTLPIGEPFTGLLDSDQLSVLLNIDIDQFGVPYPQSNLWRPKVAGLPVSLTHTTVLSLDEAWPVVEVCAARYRKLVIRASV